MVEEKLISIKELEILVPSQEWKDGMFTRNWDSSVTFFASWEYYYDGVKFYIGHTSFEKNLIMLEPLTMAYAVLTGDGKYNSPKKVVEKFKQKLSTDKRGRNLHEVIRDCINKNAEANLCLVSLLTM